MAGSSPDEVDPISHRFVILARRPFVLTVCVRPPLQGQRAFQGISTVTNEIAKESEGDEIVLPELTARN